MKKPIPSHLAKAIGGSTASVSWVKPGSLLSRSARVFLISQPQIHHVVSEQRTPNLIAMKLPDGPTDHTTRISGQRQSTDYLCNAKEAAEILRAPLPTIYYLTKNHKLPAIRIGGRWRFIRNDLKAMVNTPSMFTNRKCLGPSPSPENRELAESIARAISNAQASQAKPGPQPLSICVIIVSPTLKGGFEILPLDRVEPLLNAALPEAG